MEKKEITINSDCDGLPISVAIFIPDGEINGIFQISHGMSEHKERYYGFMKYLANKGFVAVVNDHRGHGKSVKNKEDLGYFYEKDAEFIVEDLHKVTLYIKKLYPNKNLVLFGHSMGSMVARKYIKKYDNDIDKLIICGSPSKNSFVNFGLLVVKIITFFRGERYRSEFLQNLALGKLNKKFKNSGNEDAWICGNNEILNSYKDSDLCGFIFTLNGLENLFKLLRDIFDKNGWIMNNKNLPILFIAGKDDPIIVSHDKWRKSQQFLRDLGYTNVSGKLYDNLRHELLNEKENKEVYEDIVNFLYN